jgi:hypothetical protein
MLQRIFWMTGGENEVIMKNLPFTRPRRRQCNFKEGTRSLRPPPRSHVKLDFDETANSYQMQILCVTQGRDQATLLKMSADLARSAHHSIFTSRIGTQVVIDL